MAKDKFGFYVAYTLLPAVRRLTMPLVLEFFLAGQAGFLKT